MDTKYETIKKNKLLLAIITFLLVFLLVLSMVYIRATHTERRAKTESIKIAKEYAKLNIVDDFYWFKRQETYFTVLGSTVDGEQKIVIIPKKTGKIMILNAKDGLSEQEIREKIKNDYQENAIQGISLGLYDGKPSWEVVTQGIDKSLTYYLFAFSDGQEIKIIADI